MYILERMTGIGHPFFFKHWAHVKKPECPAFSCGGFSAAYPHVDRSSVHGSVVRGCLVLVFCDYINLA